MERHFEQLLELPGDTNTKGINTLLQSIPGPVSNPGDPGSWMVNTFVGAKCEINHIEPAAAAIQSSPTGIGNLVDSLNCSPDELRPKKRKRTVNSKPTQIGGKDYEQIQKSFAEFIELLQHFSTTADSIPPSGLEEQETRDTRKQLENLAWCLGRKASSLLERIIVQLENSNTQEAENQTLWILNLIGNYDSLTKQFPWISQYNARLLRKLIRHSLERSHEPRSCSLFRQLSRVSNVRLTPDEVKQYASLLLRSASNILPILKELELLPEDALTLRTAHPFPAAHQIIFDASVDLLKSVAIPDSPQPDTNDILQRSPLHLAAYSGSLKAVKNALQIENNANCRDMFHCTPLFYAALNGNTDIIEELKKAGGKIHDQNKFGQSVLCAAARAGRVDAVRYLVLYGAVPNNGCLGYAAPLYCAAEEGHLDICRILLEKGARANEKLVNGLTAFDIALKKGHTDVATLLLDNSPRTSQIPPVPMVSPLVSPSDGFDSRITAHNYGHHDHESLCDPGTGQPIADFGDGGYSWAQENTFV
ncbi:MAG: hypothetical protein Q9160_001601 [Pyrenula sp. 1 TL-2023]